MLSFGDEEMGKWLRVMATLPKDLNSYICGSSEPSVTPGKEDMMCSSILC